MIRHFGVWPLDTDKNNLFEEQKIFLIYLLGLIPDFQGWSLQVDYKKKLKEINNRKSTKLSKTDIDLAKMQGKDIEKIKKERLREEKKKEISELNKEFGIEEKITIEPIDGLNLDSKKDEDGTDQKKQLWDMLQGKGIIGNNG